MNVQKNRGHEFADTVDEGEQGAGRNSWIKEGQCNPSKGIGPAAAEAAGRFFDRRIQLRKGSRGGPEYQRGKAHEVGKGHNRICTHKNLSETED